MRTEQEIIRQVLDWANADPDIRAVVRTDLVPVRDYLYQYNFYFITDRADRYDDVAFATCFGERILLYRGDRNYPEMFGGVKAHLMVFRDGVTMAVYLATAEQFLREFAGEVSHENVWMGRSCRKLLDKDGLLPEIDRSADSQMIFTDRPTAEAFDGTCAEFFWVLKTYAEYVLRDELPAAMFYLNVSVRDMLNRMIRWLIGMENGFRVELGILDSYFSRYLSEELYGLYRATYPTAEEESLWAAYDAMARLFHIAAAKIADRLGFVYPREMERNMLDFMERLRAAATRRE